MDKTDGQQEEALTWCEVFGPVGLTTLGMPERTGWSGHGAHPAPMWPVRAHQRDFGETKHISNKACMSFLPRQTRISRSGPSTEKSK